MRQREVLKLVADGLTTQEIGEALFVCIKTIESHRKEVYRITGTNRVARLTKFAIRAGLTTL